MATICSECGNYADPVMIDCGIGAYEYWGSCGTHVDYQPLSPCCEAECVEGGATRLRSVVRTAAKRYPLGYATKLEDGMWVTRERAIEIGERYREIVTRHWRKDGPSWVTVERVKMGGTE
jgi:hypothetical protein